MLAHHKKRARRLHHRRDGGALGRGDPLRHHERRRARTPSRSLRKSPKQPKSNLASMGIYVFIVEEAARTISSRTRTTRSSSNDFGKNIIPAMLNAGEKMSAYRFEGYWKDVGTHRFPLGREHGYARAGQRARTCSIRTGLSMPARRASRPPTSARRRRSTTASSPAARRSRARCANSVLSQRCTVAEGAEVEYSILMPGAVVERGARVAYAILGENVRRGRERPRRRVARGGAAGGVGHHGRSAPSAAGRGMAARCQANRMRSRGRKGDGTMNGLHGIIFCLRTGSGTARAGGSAGCPPPSRSADATASSISCSPIMHARRHHRRRRGAARQLPEPA